MLNLTDKEKTAWNAQGWTVEGVAHVSIEILAKSLEVAIGRAAAIVAMCKAGVPESDEVERALSGDGAARTMMQGAMRGLPWVVLRNGKPDLTETRALVKDLKERPVKRATWKGLLVVSVDGIAQAATKLPRCPLTGHVLDDYDGRLLDGETGADWGPAWPERGNGRVLWLANSRRGTLPAYAMTDPARVATELAAKEVPMQWQRAQMAWEQASPVEKAAAEERLFMVPGPVACAPTSGDSQIAQPTRPSGKAIFIGYAPDDHRAAKNLQTHLATLLRSGDCYLTDDIEQSDIMLVLVSPSLIADDGPYQMSVRAGQRNAAGISRAIPILVRSVSQYPTSLATLVALPRHGGPVRGDEDLAAIAAEVRRVIQSMLPSVSAPEDRPSLRRRLDMVSDTDFMAMCLDYFPRVYQQMTSGMTKTQKINILFSYIGTENVAAAMTSAGIR